MNHYKNKIEGIAMMMDLRTAKLVIHSIKIETVHVLNMAVHTKVDSVQAVNQ